GIDEAVGAAFHDAHQVGKGDRRVVADEREGRSVEVAAAQNFVGSGEYEGIIGGRSGFDLDDFARMGQRVPDGSVNLRHAAETVGVLNAGIVLEVGVADAAVLQKPAEVSG